MKFSVKVTLKNDVLDPQGKVVQQTLQNMGMSTLKNLRQGKYFEIEIEENNEKKANDKIKEMCTKLLVNLIIEDFDIKQL
ncbi:phosphoribosylformylglycinamidine synthase subunit PurS [Pelagibacteraceae bacterium]|nr:phosphoribosylformylglycinamidine synthase subunit PurS [Pelagibacteraceae bacterium]